LFSLRSFFLGGFSSFRLSSLRLRLGLVDGGIMFINKGLVFIKDVLRRNRGVFSSVGSGESFTDLSEIVSVFSDGITNSLLFFSSDVIEISILKGK